MPTDGEVLVKLWHEEWRWGEDPSFADLAKRIDTRIMAERLTCAKIADDAAARWTASADANQEPEMNGAYRASALGAEDVAEIIRGRRAR